MSGCHNPGKLQRCKHGDSSYRCFACEWESMGTSKDAVDPFVRQVKLLLEDRIIALEKERDLGIDRLKALEDSRGYVAALERQLAHVDRVLTSRIEKLDRLVLDVLHDLEWRITKIESAKSEKEQKVPYKCSVCKGTGIVWGDE